VTQWIDRDKYHWVRFDDFGTGMDEQIIRDHLLKVGSSYYGSAQYKADVLRASGKGGGDFTPISRFGIGLLSCFIVCDRVEISTWRQFPEGSRFKPIRLSLNGLSGYYTLQTPDLPAGAMPSQYEMDEPEGYRTEFGTSIACRIDPTKERGSFDLSAMLNSHILFPTIPIEFEGVKVAGYSTLIGKPWCTAKTVKLTAEQARSSCLYDSTVICT
jgi:hypothetical protein